MLFCVLLPLSPTLFCYFVSRGNKHHLPTPLHRSAAATVPEPSAAAAVLALLCWACCHRIPSRRLLRRGLYLVAAAQQASERKCQTRFYSFFLSGMPNPEPKPPCCWYDRRGSTAPATASTAAAVLLLLLYDFRNSYVLGL